MCGVVNSDVVSFLKMEFLNKFNLSKEIMFVDQLSRTYRKIFSIYRWVLSKPKAIILENPMLSTDIIDFQILKKYITELANQGIVVILSSNNFHELSEVCDLMICSENAVYKRTYKKLDFNDIDLNEIISENV
jgi:ABC-type Na+ transport system ATPase subunit NatA